MLGKNKPEKLEKSKNKKEEVVEDNSTENKFKEENQSEKNETREEKSLEKKEIPKRKKKLSKLDRQFYWFFGILIGFFVVFLFSYYIFYSLINKFDYYGISFERIKEGDIIFYHSIVPLTKTSGERVNYHFYFRTDPRKNEILVEGEIEIPRDLVVYISTNETGILRCPYFSVSYASLRMFLKDGGGFEVRDGVPDEARANEINLSYITCENRPLNPVILLQQGNETKITRIGSSSACYLIEVSNCEILPAIEKFQFQAVLDARARQKKTIQ